MKNAVKTNVRYGVKLFLLTLILTMMSFISASAEKVTGTDSFYYQKNGNEVIISNSGKIAAEDGGTIFVACYDGEVLEKVKQIQVGSAGVFVENCEIELAQMPENLRVEVFAWDSTNGMKPLCEAKDIGEVPFGVIRKEARITQTSKQGNEIGKATFEFAKSDGTTISYIADISEMSDIQDHFLELLVVDYTLDLNGKMTILDYSVSPKNSYVNANDDLYAGFYANGYSYDTSTTTVTTPRLELYESETSSYTAAYKVANDIKLLVNGISMAKLSSDDTVTAAELTAFSATCAQYLDGDFVVIDTPKSGATAADGLYDIISVEYYGTAIVQEVIEKPSGVKRIAFETCSFDISKAYLEIDPEDDKVEVLIFDTDGNEMTVDDIKTNDVLSIMYNPGDFVGSSFYEIIVSRDIVEGQVTGTYDENAWQYYTIDGKDYRNARGMQPDPIYVGTAYTLYLDKNGDIAKTEVLASSINYGIVDRFYESAGNTYVRIVQKDGTKADYILRADNTTAQLSTNLFSKYPLLWDANGDGDSLDAGEGTLAFAIDYNNPVMTCDRFVKYYVNSSGEITLESIASNKIAIEVDDYNSTSQRIGSYGIADSTIMLNASLFAKDTSKSVYTTNLDYLEDGMPYTAVFLGARNTSDGTYPMVVLLTGNDGYTVNSELVVAAANVEQVQVDYEDKNQIKIHTGTAENPQIKALVTEDTSVGYNVREGDAFIYSTNINGEVDDIQVIFSAASNMHNMLSSAGSLDSNVTGIAFKGENASSVNFYMYPIVKRYDGSIALAADIYDYQSSDTGVGYTYANDVKAYSYDCTKRAGYRTSISTPNAIIPSFISESGKLGGGTIIDWTHSANTPTYAIAREYEGEIQEIYSVFLNDPPCNVDTSKEYVTAVVSGVVGKRIVFTDDICGTMILNCERTTPKYTFKDTDGNTLSIDDLKENDVLTIYYDNSVGYTSSSYYTVYVSDNTATGIVTSVNGDKFTVDGKEYILADATVGIPMLGGKYELLLDKFGNVARYNALHNSDNYAIVDRFLPVDGKDMVRLILNNGTKADYVLAADNTVITLQDSTETSLLYAMDYGRYPLVSDGELITESIANEKIKTLDRFVEFSLDESGAAILSSLDSSEVAAQRDVYNATSGRIGAYGLADSTAIVNASAFAADPTKSVKAASKEYLIDDMEYLTVFVGRRKVSDGTYPMAVLLTGNNAYTVNSRMVVAADVEQTVDGNKITIYEGTAADCEEKVLLTDSLAIGADIQEGDAFIYKVNDDGKVDDIRIIFSVANVGGENMLGNVGNISTDVTFIGEDANTVSFYMYPVVKKYVGSIALASDICQISYGWTNGTYLGSSDTGVIATYAKDVNVYQYDGTMRAGNRVSLTTPSGVVQSAISVAGKMNNGLIIDWTSSANAPAYAVCREYDGDIQEIYSICFE